MERYGTVNGVGGGELSERLVDRLDCAVEKCGIDDRCGGERLVDRPVLVYAVVVASLSERKKKHRRRYCTLLYIGFPMHLYHVQHVKKLNTIPF